jgi:hypothetical protein
MTKCSSVTSNPTTSSPATRIEEIQQTRVKIIRMFELREPLDSRTHRGSIAVPRTLSTVHQNLLVTESSTMLELSKKSWYVIYLSIFTFINLLHKIIRLLGIF